VGQNSLLTEEIMTVLANTHVQMYSSPAYILGVDQDPAVNLPFGVQSELDKMTKSEPTPWTATKDTVGF
jgi:hypothetical protein